MIDFKSDFQLIIRDRGRQSVCVRERESVRVCERGSERETDISIALRDKDINM